MPIAGTKVEIVKASMAEVIRRAASRVWRPRATRIGPMPAEQKFAVIALAVAPAVTAGDHDALVAALESVAGVQKAVVVSYGVAPATADVPSGQCVKLAIDTGFAFEEIPEE